jgi:type I pantothenate kinase
MSGAFVLGIAGPVAVGKSTYAAAEADRIRATGATVEVVATDVFLLSNEQLAPLGGAMRKGYPESYDWAALVDTLDAARHGRFPLTTPVYSHETFDLVPGAVHTIETADVVVVEGLNLLQAPPDAPADMAAMLDRSIYLHASEPVIEQWFVDRFVSLARPAEGAPSDFYAMFADMDDAELDAVARWTWTEINLPNLRQHIAPTRARADVVVHKAADHRIERIEQLG